MPRPAANALINKGVVLGALGRRDDELLVYDEVLARFGGSSRPALREAGARALFNKGVVLGSLKRRDRELLAYDEVLSRFGRAPEGALRQHVARAS